MGQRPSALDNSSPSEKHSSQSSTDMTAIRYQSLSATHEEEQTPPYAYPDGAAYQSEWDDHDVPVHTIEIETQNDTPPPSPFIYNGARPTGVMRRRNVILFGETGVGKSSVINLMAGTDVAQTSSNLEGCTLDSTEYSFTLPGGMSLCIYDTVGLNESEIGVNTFFGAINKAHRLITSLHDAGGIDLLLFCIRGNRITDRVARNYRLFFEFLCEKKVPLALVVTNLEFEDVMEDWWKRNEQTLSNKYRIQSVAHACITAAPARLPTIAEKRADSRRTLQKMLHDSLSSTANSNPHVRGVRGWFASLVDGLRSFLMKRLPVSFRKRDLLKKLQNDCALSPEEAEELADMLIRG